jgi:hypothetical protein
MVNGLSLFKERFQSFNDCYTVIGGTACSILMGNAALEFRATQDIDMILLVESRQFNEFAEQLLKFIDDGGYECEERKNGTKRLYRFINTKTAGYPTMIELFSKNALDMKGNRRITYVKTDKDPSGLSAMLLSDEYYNLAMEGREKIDDVWTLQASYLIPLKMHAWINLSKDLQKGKAIDENDLLKHKYDVFRLLLLLSGETRVTCNARIRKDITAFIESMKNEDLPAESIFGDWAPEQFRANFNKEQDLERLRMIYLT